MAYDEDVFTGAVIEEIQNKRAKSTDESWVVMDAMLDDPVDFDDRPEFPDLKDIAQLRYGYSKTKMAVNEDYRIILLMPVDVSGQ